MATRVQEIWSPSDELTPRVKALRDEYFSYDKRDYFRNEVRSYTTGTEWDTVYSTLNWGVVPETMVFFRCYEDSLLAAAEKVETPNDFFNHIISKRRAIFFDRVVSGHLPIHILKGELIVGSHFNTALSRCLTKEEAEGRAKLLHKWEENLAWLHKMGIGNAGAIPGHIIPNYRKVIENGFNGIYQEIKAEFDKEQDNEKKEYLEALLISCKTPQKLADRYSKLAKREANQETDPGRKAELEEIARICSKVPWEKPETFHEGLQALWFTHMLIMAHESYPGAGLSHGRIDQYLYPLYKKDIESGKLTRAEAKELLECFFIKHNYAYDFQARLATNQGINAGFGQLITIGGCDRQGNDASNELTWLFLDAIEEMNMLEPKPNVRVHANTPDELLERLASMVARAQGAPFLLNFDEHAMEGLKWEGLPEDQIWDYAPVGCLENTLQGCDRSGTVDVNLNLAKAVELALNNGCDMGTGTQVTSQTGDPIGFKTFDEFYGAFKNQLAQILDLIIKNANMADRIRSTYEPTPYLSTLVEGCAQKRTDITAGGALHNYITVEGVAFGTAVDSVLAVKKLVFEDQRVSMEELLPALKANFAGYERLRQLLANKAPKYGNDDEYADEIARDLSTFWTRKAFERTSPATGRRYRGGYLSWNYWISYAPLTAATPDGRMRGRFLSNGIGPVNGADQNGPTATIKSVGNIEMKTAPNGASHTMSFSPAILRDKEHIRKFAGLIRTYNEVGGTALQINVLDPETLREAQQNPDEYQNLLVRVTGYNAYFVMLGKEIQDEIIARESHRM